MKPSASQARTHSAQLSSLFKPNASFNFQPSLKTGHGSKRLKSKSPTPQGKTHLLMKVVLLPCSAEHPDTGAPHKWVDFEREQRPLEQVETALEAIRGRVVLKPVQEWKLARRMGKSLNRKLDLIPSQMVTSWANFKTFYEYKSEVYCLAAEDTESEGEYEAPELSFHGPSTGMRKQDAEEGTSSDDGELEDLEGTHGPGYELRTRPVRQHPSNWQIEGETSLFKAAGSQQKVDDTAAAGSQQKVNPKAKGSQLAQAAGSQQKVDDTAAAGSQQKVDDTAAAGSQQKVDDTAAAGSQQKVNPKAKGSQLAQAAGSQQKVDDTAAAGSQQKVNPKAKGSQLAQAQGSDRHADTTPVDDLLRELDSFVGLKTLKMHLAQFAKCIFMQRKVGHQEQVGGLHMVFTGNPGTGKTSVATALAGFLYKLGMITKPKPVTVQRGDLISKWIGQTTETTRAKIAESKGGVMLIDEAYRLAQSDSSKRDVGRESLEELMSVMEGGDPIMIFAGYPAEMASFLDVNPGMKSRIAFHFNFPDFSVGELASIMRNEVANKGLRFTDQANQDLETTIENNSTKEQRSEMNGRLARQVLTGARRGMYTRCYPNDIDGCSVITQKDLEESFHSFLSER
ncbi:ESX-1 secretion system protein EccA1-like isoform X2 [Branchiostoma lanceolatum]|uniref:ESX-1 secretion system protein EccA1-like isoform X2 n=1 Tax=Branchiostoma lanceolatum TaxID=7740 RepID=UPI003453BFFF